MDRERFYAALRRKGSGVFGTSLTQAQVDGIETILAACAGLRLPFVAYILATAYHETAYTMQPVRETLAATDGQAIARLERAWKAGRLKWVKTPYWRRDADGKTWLGRGYVQLTHRANYETAGRKIGVDLVTNPDAAMQPTVAALILVRGSLEGWFTGKKLTDYAAGDGFDYVNARRVINGDVKGNGAKIAAEAKAFEAALIEAEWTAEKPKVTPIRPTIAPPPPAPPVAKPAPKFSLIAVAIGAAAVAVSQFWDGIRAALGW